MRLTRLGLVWRLNLGQHLRQWLFWILIVVVGLTTYGLSSGNVLISSGDSSVGGTKAWLTSEFSVAVVLTLVVFLLYAFFIAVAAGMTVIRDDELGVGELLHATPLRPGEYVWGKFLAVLIGFLAVLAINLLFLMFFHHLFPNAQAAEIRGPFALRNYLVPATVFAFPAIVFLAGTAFAVGAWTRRPILVFVLPVVLILVCVFFLWTWTPTWLDPRVDAALMLVDPSGFRWLEQTWLKVDRGADFYNQSAIPFDVPFLLSRLVFLGIGLGAVALSGRSVAAIVRGSRKANRGWLGRVVRRREAAGANREPAPAPGPLGDLAMRAAAPGLVRGILAVAHTELRELRSQPGLYLFVPIILLQTIGTNLVAFGAFQTPLLLTSGTLAVGAMNTLTLLVCLLLLFYTVESLERERSTRLAAIHDGTPVRTASVLFGKALANSAVGAAILLAAFLGCAIVLLIQGKIGVAVGPFVLIWGLFLTITFLGWTSFVTAVLAVTGNRYATYGICLAAMTLTGYRQARGKMNWVGNWDLWSVLRWTDMGLLEMDRIALLLNRALVLGLAVFFTALAVRFYRRRDLDPGRVVGRLRPLPLLKATLRLMPYALVPLVVGTWLWFEVDHGFQGESTKKLQKDYWKQNLATWKDAPLPALTSVDLDLDLEPSRSWFRVTGSYELRNHHEKVMRQVPLTGGDHWENVRWTLDGEPFEPDNRSRLFVFTPPRPLAPGEQVRIGFAFEGIFPKGITKNGGGAGEFILPAGVALTSFRPSCAPVVGYIEDIGVDDDNRYESRVYPDDFFEGITEPLFGSAAAFTTRIRITAPEEYTLNSVGTLVSNAVTAGRRTVVWESDEPVRHFNVVAGRYTERRGRDTVIYHHPEHAYNIEEMSQALDAARRFYSEWFFPFPWRELKLSEFPNQASYAQGFPTNITFSEGIGFLTKSDPRTNAAFVVTAHEAAHQWWGNLVVPGKGPGGNVLSEGMAHFSTVLLCEQVKGLQARIEFCKRIEESYGEGRRKDSERPLVWIDGSRPGDTAATYDKGGWVFWMLFQHLGRERALNGLQEFVRQYRLNPDHPVLQDFIAVMRPFAADEAAFEAFVKQWFFEVVVPEYQLNDARRVQQQDEAPDSWEVRVTVKNVGSGRLPIEVAAVKGERFDADGQELADYRDSRVTVVLGPGDAQEVTIRCPFQPERLLVDPDARVLQLLRKRAVVRF
jgi:ABC-type transport system involved in multi-copper enzyme maturation permease subunit